MKRTAKQRIARAVATVCGSRDPEELLNAKEAIALILAERARLKRWAKKLMPDADECAAYQNGYREANADVLNLWNEDKEGKP